MNVGEPVPAVTPSPCAAPPALALWLWASAASSAVPLPAPPLPHTGEATIPFYNLSQTKSFTRGSQLTLECPCVVTQMKARQSRSRLGFSGQCRPLVRPFLLASIAVTRTTGINYDLTA